jgi:hypothetical protein
MVTLILQLVPSPVTVPVCRHCHQSASRYTTRQSNRNGNAGRPYYKCTPCNSFVRFDDSRGNDSNNPLCFCRESSRMQVTGLGKSVPRALHYVCKSGACDFYDTRRDGLERQIVLDGDLVDLLAGLQLI